MKLESGVELIHDPNLINNEFALLLEMLNSGNEIKLYVRRCMWVSHRVQKSK